MIDRGLPYDRRLHSPPALIPLFGRDHFTSSCMIPAPNLEDMQRDFIVNLRLRKPHANASSLAYHVIGLACTS